LVDLSATWVRQLRGALPGRLRKDEWTVEVCPFCGNASKNFEVNLEKLVFHCWACHESGRVPYLLRTLNIDASDVPQVEYHHSVREVMVQADAVSLPAEAEDVMTCGHPWAKWAFNYLTGRGLTRDDIILYRVKLCTSGDYERRVIFPLYEGPSLVWFVARAFTNLPMLKYKYPEGRRGEFLSVFRGSGENKLVLVLVEGVFQVPSVHRLGYSVAPLLGTGLSQQQAEKIRAGNWDKVVVLLDADAVKEAIEMAERLRVLGVRAVWGKTSGPDTDELESDELRAVLDSSREPSMKDRVLARLRGML